MAFGEGNAVAGWVKRSNGDSSKARGPYPNDVTPLSIIFDFNIQHASGSSRYEFGILARDFTEVAKTMMDADQKEAIKAFVKALQSFKG